MATHPIGIILHGATGRIGGTQHLANALAPIRDEGGLPTGAGNDRIVPRLMLAGRDAARVEAAAKKHNAHFIFLSTDFIFDGKNGPYREEDAAAPLSIYGQSKLDGEQLVMNSGLAHWAIARTIIVYGVAAGLSRSNVVLWAKGALEKGSPINVVDDQYRMPTLAEDLADGCIRIAKRKAQGVYHLCGPDGMTILELVQRVAKYYELDDKIVTRIDSASLSQPAERPPRTGFVLDKARKDLGYTPHSFEEGLDVLTKQLKGG